MVCIVSRVEGFWPDGQENDGAGTAFPRPPSVRPEREREKSLVLESVCMEAGITGGERREGRTLLFPSGLFCPLFTQRKEEEGKAGREGAKETRKRGAVTFATKKWGIHQ